MTQSPVPSPKGAGEGGREGEGRRGDSVIIPELEKSHSFAAAMFEAWENSCYRKIKYDRLLQGT